jgi:hypothetical protein
LNPFFFLFILLFGDLCGCMLWGRDVDDTREAQREG